MMGSLGKIMEGQGYCYYDHCKNEVALRVVLFLSWNNTSLPLQWCELLHGYIPQNFRDKSTYGFYTLHYSTLIIIAIIIARAESGRGIEYYRCCPFCATAQAEVNVSDSFKS